MKDALTIEILQGLLGKTIKWQAPIYSANVGYYGHGLTGGITKIIKIDASQRRPILEAEKLDPASDDICFAFKSDFDDILAFSDEDRFVTYKLISE